MTAITLAILTPLLGAFGVLATGKKPDLREGTTLLAGAITFTAVLSLLPRVLAGETVGTEWLEVLPGVALAFEVEPLGMLYALVASGLWMPTSLYAAGYLRGHHEKNQTRFFACFALAIFAAQVVLSSLWMARARSGPFELLWRRLTYGRRQPSRS